MCMCVYIYMCVCIYIYIYIYTAYPKQRGAAVLTRRWGSRRGR